MDTQDDKSSDFPLPLRLPKYDEVNAVHAIIEAAESMQWDFKDREAFLKRVKHIEHGLSAEDEFSALLGWLGRCRLVHRLGQKWESSFESEKWGIPDLFAVFRLESSELAAMIEVKTTSDGLLKLREDYVRRLRDYSALHSHPLLIAWRPRSHGFWILFDPDLLRSQGNWLVIDVETALKSSLMSSLAGDFGVVSMKDAGLFFFLRRVSDRVPNARGYTATFVYENIVWRDANEVEYDSLPRSIKYLIFSTFEFIEQFDEESGVAVKAFVSQGGLSFAQNIFRTLVGGWVPDGEPIRWNHVHENREVLLYRDELLAGLEEHFGTFVHTVIQQIPVVWPRFFPEPWEQEG